MSPLVIGIIIAVVLIIIIVVVVLIMNSGPSLPSNFPKSYPISEGKIMSKDELVAARDTKFNLPFVPNTVSAWVKIDPSYVTTNRVGGILGNHDGFVKDKNSFNFELHARARPRYYKSNNYDGTQITMDAVFEPSTPVIPNDVWANVIIVRDTLNKKVILFLDGVEKVVYDYSKDPNESKWFDNTIRLTDYIIGNDLRAGEGIPFNGSLSTIRVFEDILSPEQIKQLYDVDKYNLQKIAPPTDVFQQVSQPLPTQPAAQSIRFNSLYRIMTSRLNLQP